MKSSASLQIVAVYVQMVAICLASGTNGRYGPIYPPISMPPLLPQVGSIITGNWQPTAAPISGSSQQPTSGFGTNLLAMVQQQLWQSDNGRHQLHGAVTRAQNLGGTDDGRPIDTIGATYSYKW